MLKVNKNDSDFSKKSAAFYLDCGWIRFIKELNFKESLMDFKSSNMDPRELIMLFKSDLMLSPLSLDKHFEQI